MGVATSPWIVKPSWTRAARGFSCIFWGILLCLLLYSGFLVIRTSTFRPTSPELPGLLLVVVGGFMLLSSGTLSVSWSHATRRVVVASLCVLAFAPFLEWWRRMPHLSMFSANVLALMLSILWLLIEIHRLAGETGKMTGNPTLRVESNLCLWSTVLLYGIPLIAIIARSSPSLFEMQAGNYVLPVLLLSWPRWIHVAMLAPFLLAMAIAWEAKEVCLRQRDLETHPA